MLRGVCIVHRLVLQGSLCSTRSWLLWECIMFVLLPPAQVWYKKCTHAVLFFQNLTWHLCLFLRTSIRNTLAATLPKPKNSVTCWLARKMGQNRAASELDKKPSFLGTLSFNGGVPKRCLSWNSPWKLHPTDWTVHWAVTNWHPGMESVPRKQTLPWN